MGRLIEELYQIQPFQTSINVRHLESYLKEPLNLRSLWLSCKELFTCQ